MALHTELPIHRAGVELLGMAFALQQNMPRAFKRSLGEKVTDHCMEMLDNMAMANATQHQERVAHIHTVLKHLRATTVLLRVAHDGRAIPTKHWAAAVKVLDSIGRQGGGWLKSTANRAPAA